MDYPNYPLPAKLQRLQEGLAELKLMFADMPLKEFSALVNNRLLVLDAAREPFPSQWDQQFSQQPATSQHLLNPTKVRGSRSGRADERQLNVHIGKVRPG